MPLPPSTRYFLFALTSLLLGYMFLGRGFAHVGLGPIYVGELVLIYGVCIVVMWSLWRTPLRSPLVWIILIFMIWGAIRTIPFIPEHGMDALRDGVVWGYGAFALLTAAVVGRLRLIERILDGYGRLVPIAICALPVLFVAHLTISDYLPRPPGSELPLLYLKGGDTAVHLGAAMAFLLLGLHQWRRPLGKVTFGPRQYLLIVPWILGFAVAGIINRGGFLAAVAAGAVTAVLSPFGREWKRLLLLFLLVFFGALLLDVRWEGNRRTISARQMVVNIQSIWETALDGTDDAQSDTATAHWRIIWWRDIMDYTLFGPYRWTGRGFGENLNDGRYGPLDIRSPHNSHLTILARGGVPGIALWILLNGVFAWKLLEGFIVARRLRAHVWMRVNAWILAFWLAFVVNTFFDVYLEGPQGGIWFWCLIGFGIAALQQQWEEYRSASSNPRLDALPLPGQDKTPAGGVSGRNGTPTASRT